jgi:hypothetical protein
MTALHRRIHLPRTRVNKSLSYPCVIFYLRDEVRELLVRVHKGFCKLWLVRRCHDG